MFWFLSTTYTILSNILLSRLTPYAEKIIGDHNVDFHTTGEQVIIIVHSSNTWGKKWEYDEAVHQLFINFLKACDSVRWEALYNILIEFGIPMKLGGLIKMCLY